MSRLADVRVNLYRGMVNPTRKMIDPKSLIKNHLLVYNGLRGDFLWQKEVKVLLFGYDRLGNS